MTPVGLRPKYTSFFYTYVRVCAQSYMQPCKVYFIWLIGVHKRLTHVLCAKLQYLSWPNFTKSYVFYELPNSMNLSECPTPNPSPKSQSILHFVRISEDSIQCTWREFLHQNSTRILYAHPQILYAQVAHVHLNSFAVIRFFRKVETLPWGYQFKR